MNKNATDLKNAKPHSRHLHSYKIPGPILTSQSRRVSMEDFREKYVRGARAKTSTGTFKKPVREANLRNSHIAVHNKKRPRPKTQNPVLGIYIATKFQDPSRLLRLAVLV